MKKHKNNCNHLSFWQIYKIINFSVRFSSEKGRPFKCEKCDKKCVMKWKGYKKMNKSFFKRIFTYLLWLSPAFILIAMVASGNTNFLVAIGLVIVYHFLAMIFIINSSRLKISEK